jgi:hypothetical protein
MNPESGIRHVRSDPLDGGESGFEPIDLGGIDRAKVRHFPRGTAFATPCPTPPFL